MKKIEAIVRHFKVEEVKDALNAKGVAGHDRHRRARIRTSKGTHGNVPRHRIRRRVHPQVEDRSRRLRRQRPNASSTPFSASARTGQVGDGKIFVSDLSGAIRIRTGESDDAAV